MVATIRQDKKKETNEATTAGIPDYCQVFCTCTKLQKKNVSIAVSGLLSFFP
jgi:hypothetical protein